MRLLKSVCTNLLFPASRKSIDEFRRMAGFVKAKGAGGIEFYHDGEDRDAVGKVIADTGLDAIYIAVIPSKESRLWLCDTDREQLKMAVALLKRCIDEAAANGIEKVMINSGGVMADVDAGLAALTDSVEQLYDYAESKRYPFNLRLEPCDSIIDAKHFVGPYRRAADFAKRMRSRGFPLELTMDTAHTAEEGEDFAEALAAAKPYCSHVHFANCRVADPADPLYGDKHIGFEYSGSVWTPAALAELFPAMQALYPGDEPLRVAVEVLCREDDPYSYFETLWDSLPFLTKA